MSRWTGELYGVYTTKPTDKVFDALKKEASNLGYQCEYHSYNGEESLFFYKDTEMLEHHLETGYNTDINEQGCFCIEAKCVNLHGIASLFEFESKSDFEPYDINLLLDDVFYYVLIIPDFIENSAFCSQIHSSFFTLIKRLS